MLSIFSTLDAPAKQLSQQPPSPTATRVPAAAHGEEALMAAPQVALHGLLHIGMRWLGPHAAVRTLHCVAGQQRLRSGRGCWLRELPLHVWRP